MKYDDAALCRTLLEMPSRYNYLYSADSERALLRALFLSISANEKYSSYFFPHGMPSMSVPWRMHSSDLDPSHRGRPCMHQFEKGEPTYKCKDCAVDETCVLCWQCFNSSDHVGHQVTVSISQKDDGGVCDCGDPEAWKRQVTCQYFQSYSQPSQPLPEDLIDCIKGTIARVLDYILDVFSCAPQSYQDCKDETAIEADCQSFSLLPSVYGGDGVDKHNGQYALVLWNDEKHAFDAVIETVARATRRGTEYGKFISTEVDTIGRTTVSTSSDLKRLIAVLSKFESIALAGSIRSMRDTFREDMCGTMLDFLKDISMSSLEGHDFVLRDAVCEALCQPWRVGSTATRIHQTLYPIADHLEDSDDDLHMVAGAFNTAGGAVHVPGFESSVQQSVRAGTPVATQAPNYWTETAEDDPTVELAAREAANNTEWQMMNSKYIPPDQSHRLRLDYLMIFDMRFWKKARVCIRDLLMATMISNLDYKMTLGMHYADAYPDLVEQFVLADREPEYSIMQLATQLYTCPTIATEVARLYFPVFAAIIYTLLTKGKVGSPSSVDFLTCVPVDRSTLKNSRVYHVYSELEHIISRNLVKQRISCDNNKVRQVADILLLLEGSAPFIRQINEHVEYESTEWISSFHILTPLSKLARLIASGCSEGSPASSQQSIRSIARILTAWALGYMRDRFPSNEVADEPKFDWCGCDDFSTEAYNIVRFPVEFYILSMHHPLHSFLTWFIEFGHAESPEKLKSLMSFALLDPPMPGRAVDYEPEEMLRLMLDYPLRTLVVVAQIRAGLWVRNGYTLRTHELHYRDTTMRENGYARDIFGVQTLMTTCEPSAVMLTIIDRWSLMGWLKGSVSHNVFDEVKHLAVMEEFLHGMIVLLCERKRLIGLRGLELNAALIRREIVQALCIEPMPFSDLVKKVPEYLTADEQFENILRETAIHKAPEGVNDVGLYELKDEYFDQVDPYFFHYTATQWDEAETAIKKVMHKKSKVPVDQIVVEPRLVPITSGPFTRLGWIVGTPEFAQMIYVTLGNVAFKRLSHAPSLAESLLTLTLYLCHVAVLEDQIAAPDPARSLRTFSYNACELVTKDLAPVDGICQTILEILFYIKKAKSEFGQSSLVAERIIQIIKTNEPSAYRQSLESFTESVEPGEPNDVEMNEAGEDEETEAEKKKRLAKERQAKILAEFKQKQQSFADQNKDDIEEEEDASDDDMMEDGNGESWKFPSGGCILCRKPTNDSQLYGTIGLFTESNVFRQMPFDSNEMMVDGLNADEAELDRPSLTPAASFPPQSKDPKSDNSIGKGFPNESVIMEPVVVSCGHIIHLTCLQDYKDEIQTRHRGQITRNPPEDTSMNEFLCPLCKSLNNAFFPLLYKNLDQSLTKELSDGAEFSEWFAGDVWKTITNMKVCSEGGRAGAAPLSDMVVRNIRASALHNMSQVHYQKAMIPPGPHFPGAFMSIEDRRGMSRELETLAKINSDNAKVLDRFPRVCGGLEVIRERSLLQRLLNTYSATISSAEIYLRGANGAGSGLDVGACILDQVPQRTMTLLRTLRAYALQVASFSIQEDKSFHEVRAAYSMALNQQIGKLFFGQECMYDKNSVSSPDIVYPLLMEDIFGFLADSSIIMIPAMGGADLHNIMTLCYIAQVVKVIYHLGDQIYRDREWIHLPEIQALGSEERLPQSTLKNMNIFLCFVLANCGDDPENLRGSPFVVFPGAAIYTMINRFTLPFLRKAALLAYTSSPMEYNGDALLDIDGDETARLLSLLKLPTIDEIFASLNRCDLEQNVRVKDVITRWCRHLELTNRRPQSLQSVRMTLEYPGILRLLRLPLSLHAFFQEIGRMKCKNCGNSPGEPAVCLFCGELVCCQEYCCRSKECGECNQHMEKCAKYFGVFLLIKKSSILYLRRNQGMFAPAPYLDVHGEVDQYLKRGRPLFLSQKRYDHLIRNVWLQNGFASQIARRIEAGVDVGGWQSM
ncbi:hypothetical protein BZA70DRAFT_279603 [Myxozyma melibiosi]|uniref:E3 ubiquitin-protein ligase n=1 Tax=Myxozyma melibiosi TaxID=54550 RepID=A0ABR1F460_9ASCO